MPVFLGQKSQTLYWGAGNAAGGSNVRLYLGEKRVYMPFRPPEGDLLLAGSGVYLKGAAEVYLDYTNTPQVLVDTLSGKDVGTGPFAISFSFVPRAYASRWQLLALEGMVRVGYDWSRGEGLLVWLPGLAGQSVATQPYGGPVTAALNTVQLGRGDDQRIRLRVNGAEFILFEPQPTQPALALQAGELVIFQQNIKNLRLQDSWEE